jgi:hypothetical protein
MGRDLSPGSAVMTKPCRPASSVDSALLQAFLCASISLAECAAMPKFAGNHRKFTVAVGQAEMVSPIRWAYI